MAQSWTLLQKMTLWNDSWKSIISHFLISCEGHWPRALLQLLFMANKTSQPTFLLIYVKMNSHPFNLFFFFLGTWKKKQLITLENELRKMPWWLPLEIDQIRTWPAVARLKVDARILVSECSTSLILVCPHNIFQAR